MSCAFGIRVCVHFVITCCPYDHRSKDLLATVTNIFSFIFGGRKWKVALVFCFPFLYFFLGKLLSAFGYFVRSPYTHIAYRSCFSGAMERWWSRKSRRRGRKRKTEPRISLKVASSFIFGNWALKCCNPPTYMKVANVFQFFLSYSFSFFTQTEKLGDRDTFSRASLKVPLNCILCTFLLIGFLGFFPLVCFWGSSLFHFFF